MNPPYFFKNVSFFLFLTLLFLDIFVEPYLSFMVFSLFLLIISFSLVDFLLQESFILDVINSLLFSYFTFLRFFISFRFYTCSTPYFSILVSLIFSLTSFLSKAVSTPYFIKLHSFNFKTLHSLLLHENLPFLLILLL